MLIFLIIFGLKLKPHKLKQDGKSEIYSKKYNFRSELDLKILRRLGRGVHWYMSFQKREKYPKVKNGAIQLYYT